MKSLEHLIRLVHEGKAEKGEKSSLEHAIRKIRETKLDDIESTKATRAGRFDTKMTESDLNYMGSGTGGEPKMHTEDGKKKKTDEAVGTIGTDDYQGNQFKSVRTTTPHIEPPAGPNGHSQAPENVSRQRTLAKEKSSMTLHGKVSEAVKPKEVEAGLDMLGKLWRSGSTKGREIVPYVEKGVPAKVKGKELTVPKKETEVSTKVEPKVEVPAKTDTKVQQEIPTKTPTTVTEPKVEVPAKTDTKTKPVEPKTAPVTVTEPIVPVVAPKPVAPIETPKPAAAAEPKPATPEPGKPGGPFVPPFIPSFGSNTKTDYGYDVLHRLGVKKSRGIAKAHRMHEDSERKQIENVPRKGDRKSIAYIGRSEDDPKTAKEKTSRQAAYKINVIDENRKLAGIVLSTVKDKKQQMKRTEDGLGQSSKNIQYPNGTVVSINPELSRTTMDIDGKLPNDYK
jgi:hypothetical protein